MATINIVNHHQVVEAIMAAVTTVTIPVVAKTTINHKIKTVTQIVMAAEVALEMVAVAIIVAVMVMEVEAVEAIIVIVLVEAMVEVF